MKIYSQRLFSFTFGLWWFYKNTVEFLWALLSFPETVASSFLFQDRAWADILEFARYWKALRASWRYLIETPLSFCMTWIWPWLPPEQTTYVKLIGLAARSKNCGQKNQTIILNLYLEEWSFLSSTTNNCNCIFWESCQSAPSTFSRRSSTNV